MPITAERVWNDIIAKLLQGLLILLPSLLRLVHLRNRSPNSGTDRRIHHGPCAVVPRGDSCQGGKGSVFIVVCHGDFTACRHFICYKHINK
jgi:hypothetical protein